MTVWEFVKAVLKQVTCFIVFVCSFSVPRNKKVWLYGNLNGSFRDNAKYLFIYNSAFFPEIKHIWISQSRDVVSTIHSIGLRSVYKYSIPSLFYGLIAKVYIYNHAPTDAMHGCMRGSALLFNLWHGVPFKKIEYDIMSGSEYRKFFNPKNFSEKLESFLFEPKIFRNSDYVLATSNELVPVFSSAFRLPADKIFVGTYPRNEVLKLTSERLIGYIIENEALGLVKILDKIKSFRSSVIYMPTFRDNNPDFMNVALPDLEKLNDECKGLDILFLIKAHPLTRFGSDLSKFSHIMCLDNNIDVYPLLPFTNALISDYSSIIFDYSLLDRQILFYAFDKEEYLSENRESYFEYEKVFSKEIISDFDSLLRNVALLYKIEFKEYPSLKKFVQNADGMEAITKHIKKSINFKEKEAIIAN